MNAVENLETNLEQADKAELISASAGSASHFSAASGRLNR